MPGEALLKRQKTDEPIAKLQTKSNEFFAQTPSVISVPLVGLGIIDIESSATKYSPAEISAIKTKYSDSIELGVKLLYLSGYKQPQNKDDLYNLCFAICSLIWSNYGVAETDLLVQGLKDGQLDCDTSSYVMADVLNQFGVKSKLVDVGGHVILHAEANNTSLYFDTASYGWSYLSWDRTVTTYDSEQAVKEDYSTIYGECKFQADNYLTYYSRASVKYSNGDKKGAIADYTEVIRLHPTDQAAYFNRAIAKSDVGDYKGAIEDSTKAITLDPNDASAYLIRSDAEKALGEVDAAEIDRYLAFLITYGPFGPGLYKIVKALD